MMTPAIYPDTIFIRHGGRFVKILLAEISYLEARQHYVRIVTKTRSYLVQGPLKRFIDVLPATDFCQIHRTYIIAFTWLGSFDNKKVYGPDGSLPIGEEFRSRLLQSVLLITSGSPRLTRTLQSTPTP